MLTDLGKRTGMPCNPHTFRRTFASELHRKGLMSAYPQPATPAEKRMVTIFAD